MGSQPTKTETVHCGQPLVEPCSRSAFFLARKCLHHMSRTVIKNQHARAPEDLIEGSWSYTLILKGGSSYNRPN